VILPSLPADLLKQLEIPVLGFQAADVTMMHHARSTGALLCRNQDTGYDSVWVQACTTLAMRSVLSSRLVAKPVALLKIRDYRCDNTDTLLQIAGI